MTAFSNKVIYQIYPKSFYDSNGDGVGDLPGIIEKLDYLQELNVDYLWLTPFFLSPQNDNGYDIADYCRIDPRFGTMEDLEELIQRAKDRDMGIMLDMVFNHTSTDHIWFQKAVDGDQKYQNYYYFFDGQPDHPPTNWESKFGGAAWEYLPQLKKWYLHLFDVTQADLNWNNPEVREELKAVIRFWKEKGIQGFRFDVVNLISKPDTWQDDLEGDGRKYYSDGPYVHLFLKELIRDTNIEDMITVGEMSSTTLSHCIRYSDPKEKELSMCFHFHHLKADYKDGNKWSLMKPDRKELKQLLIKWQLGMQKGNGWDAVFWSNHDQPRIVSRLGDEGTYWMESATMLAATMYLLRGTPCIYQGEEIGMRNPCYTSIHEYQDVESLNYYKILIQQGKSVEEALDILAAKSRDNSRTPMQWNSAQHAGFSDAEPWLSVPEHSLGINVAAQQRDNQSILNFYKRLIALRKGKKAISDGTVAFWEEDNPHVFAFQRKYGEQELGVWNNWGDQIEEVQLPEGWKAYEKVLGNYREKVSVSEGYRICLRPYETVVLERKI